MTDDVHLILGVDSATGKVVALRATTPTHKIKIRKVEEAEWITRLNPLASPWPGMWTGECTCGLKTQFWFWGSTLGYMMQHQWQMSMGVDRRNH